MRDLHVGIAWFLIITNAIAGIWALAAQNVASLRRPALWWLIGIAQLSTFAMAVVGVLLANQPGEQLGDFHALYGFTTIVAVGVLYSYRTSPFIRGKQWMLYGFGSLFIMGLGIRAMFLDGNVAG